MVDIIIGIKPSANVGENPLSVHAPRENLIDAKVLDIRPARRARKNSPDSWDERRRTGRVNADPNGSTVLVLMVNDAANLPNDLNSGNYRVSLRITQKKHEQRPSFQKLKA